MRLMQKAMVFAVVAGLLAAVQPAVAQDATPADRATVQKCLDEKIAASEEREGCVGVIADPCLEKSEDPSTFGMADCSRREYAVWDDRLNETYRKLMKELDAKQQRELRELQRAWIAFSDRKCGFHRVMQPEGSIIIPIAAYCAMQEVGRQATFLETMLAEGDSR